MAKKRENRKNRKEIEKLTESQRIKNMLEEISVQLKIDKQVVGGLVGIAKITDDAAASTLNAVQVQNMAHGLSGTNKPSMVI